MSTTSYPYAVPSDLSEWAQDVEALGSYPASDSPGLIAWGTAEGGSWGNPDYGNVLGTTLPEPGSAPTNSDLVQNYDASGQTQAQAWSEGLTATISMINQQNMAPIAADLQAGDPNQGLGAAVGSTQWGTSAAAIDENYGASGGAAGTPSPGSTSTGAGSTAATTTGLNLNPLDLFGIGGSITSGLGGIFKGGGNWLAEAGLAGAGILIMVLGIAALAKDSGVGRDVEHDAPVAALAAA